MNKPIPTSELAKTITTVWSKGKYKSPLDLRAHVWACKEAGDDAGAEAFLKAAGNAWWVPLYRTPDEATGRAILADDIRKHPRPDAVEVERYLDVARRVPSLRHEALARVDEVTPDMMNAFGSYPVGSLAEVDPARAIAVLETFAAKLRDAERKEALATVWSADPGRVRDLVKKLEIQGWDLAALAAGVDTDAATWVELVESSNDPRRDWSLEKIAQSLAERTDDPTAKDKALELYEACEKVVDGHISLLIDLGRMDEAKALLAKRDAEDPRVEAGLRLEQRLQLGTIDLEEARLRAGHAQVDGIPLHPEHPRKRDQVLFGLLLLVRILMRQEPRNAKAINSLLDECDALVAQGSENPRGAKLWAGYVVEVAAARMALLRDEDDHGVRATELIALAKAQMKTVPASDREFVVRQAIHYAVAADPLTGHKLVKALPPAQRPKYALQVMNAFVSKDPAGAALALTDLCAVSADGTQMITARRGALEILTVMHA
ncbi:MAG: hypothetical protein CMN30_07265 [Sandaracinus sp.]|nr:hypothetical protein [Sandaracinus sp.]|tara:strand:+ start:912 stop:2384 length:1473 start_codon:yes stop_codon:yes gene_type:complete